MRILVVAMCDSVHTARWLSQFEDTEAKFVLFPATPHRRTHPIIRQILRSEAPFIEMRRLDVLLAFPLGLADLVCANRLRGFRLRRLIRHGNFDFVHLLETQHAGYLFRSAMNRRRSPVPVALSIWGSDLVWFERQKRHHRLISETLAHVNHLFIECLRDRELALQFGYQGDFSQPIPASGGLHEIANSRSEISMPSQRNAVVVKGYTGFVGRADVALAVLTDMEDSLRDFAIHFYSVSYVMWWKLKFARWRTGLDIRAYKKKSLSHEEVLSLFQTSRLSLALSRSDGLSGSMREAAWTGSFPIESVGSCVCDWSPEGVGVLVVDPDIPDEVASAVTRALQDDALVDGAVEANRNLVRRLGADQVKAVARQEYDRLMKLSLGSR